MNLDEIRRLAALCDTPFAINAAEHGIAAIFALRDALPVLERAARAASPLPAVDAMAAEEGVGRECGCIEGNDMSLTTCCVNNCPVHGADAPHCGRCGTPRQAGATLNIEVDGRHFDELCEPCMRVAKRCLVCFGAHAGSFSRVDGGVRCGRCGHVAPDAPAPVTAQDAVEWDADVEQELR